jgi:uncharacterized alkaline shock family protein YloU
VPEHDGRREEELDRVTREPRAGRSLATRRAIRDLVRTAVLSVYGVTGFAGGGPVGRVLERAGLAHPGLRLDVGRDRLAVDLRLTVAYGLPVAEVARQVEASVRYTLRHALGREPERVSIRIGRLSHLEGVTKAPAPAPSSQPGPSELADSGTDVA